MPIKRAAEAAAKKISRGGSKNFTQALTTLPNAKAIATQTRITVKYDVGFANALYLRGEGPNLTWSRGVKLRNIKADEWVWETDQHFLPGEFKVLVNDIHFESGENHKLIPGTNIIYTPSF